MRSQGSTAGTVMGYRMNGRSLTPSKGKRLFSSSKCLDQLWKPPSLLPNGYWGVRQLMHEADHSPPSNAEAKNGGAIPPLPHVSSWHSIQLIKHRNNFGLPTVPVLLSCICITAIHGLFSYPEDGRSTFPSGLVTIYLTIQCVTYQLQL
jgi:hypothetical protein